MKIMKFNPFYSKSVLSFLVVFAPNATAQPNISPAKTATITGKVVDSNGLAQQANVSAVAGQFVFQTLTGTGGTFVFRDLPAGSYAFCGVPTSSTWDADPFRKTKVIDDPFVDSCALIDSSTPRVSVKTGESVAGASLILRRGRLVTVRINDSAKLLPAQDSKQPGKELGIRIVGNSGIVHRMRILSVDSGGRTHGFVVPYDEVHKLFIQSNDFDLKDESGKDPALSPVQFSISRGGPDVQRVISVNTKAGK